MLPLFLFDLNMKHITSVILGLVVFGLCSWKVGFVTELDENLQLFNSVIRTIDAYYVEDVDANALVLNAIDYTVESLDPFSKFYDAEETIEREKFSWNGILYAGIGINLNIINEEATVVGVREGYGAQLNDVRVGDRIISVDGESTKGLSASEVADLIKGKEHEEVLLAISRDKTKLRKKIVKRFIEDKPVPYFELFDSTGYIKFNHFLRGSAAKLRAAVQSLLEQGAQRIIIDLRGNYGGLISEAVNASSLFVELNSEVMSQRGKHPQNNYKNATENNPVAEEIPIIAVIDSLTISAAEIFVGAMQDHDRMLVLGDRSAGKGIVQGTYYPGLGTSIYMTVSAYYIPSGRSIQNLNYSSRYVGKNPVRRDSTEGAYLTASGRTVNAGGGIEPDIRIGWQKPSPYVNYGLNTPETFDFLNRYANSANKDEVTLDFEFDSGDFEKIFNTIKKNSDDIKLRLDETVATLETEWEKLTEEEYSGLSALKMELSTLKEAGLEQSKDQLKEALEREIVRRFYFEQGYYRNQFLQDRQRYNYEQYFEQYNSILNVE